MWSRSNKTTNRATSEVAVEVEIEAIMVDAAETEVEGVGAVVVVAVGEGVPECGKQQKDGEKISGLGPRTI